MKAIFVTGTDTNVGKTIVSAGLCLKLKASYWKPIQAGKPTDNKTMARFIPKKNIHPSAYFLKHPMSPNQAGSLENITIKTNFLINKFKKIKSAQQKNQFLIIEGAGGLMVPYNNKEFMRDLILHFKTPVILTARSGLGTLNHTFLSLQALKLKKIPVLGVIMIGPQHLRNKKDIEKYGNTTVLLELPLLKPLSKEKLKTYFKKIMI